MNLLLLTEDELSPDGTARLEGRRAQHAREVLKAQAGDTLRVGVVGGRVGTAEVLPPPVEATPDTLLLRVSLTAPPPPRPGVDLLLAIPRPKALKKVLPAVASLGVDRIVLVNAARVEKSYFDSYVLSPEKVRELLLLGLEQARDTALPAVQVEPRFRPFVEDRLDATFGPQGPAQLRLCAHPLPDPAAEGPASVRAPGQRLLLAVGPEGGWVPFELELLQARGFGLYSLGPRILRVEVAVPYLLGRLDSGTQRA